MMTDFKEIIKHLKLQPHPEGGYYRETYRSEGRIPEEALPDSMLGERNFATAIYFLITSEDFSAFHKINQDETWHFYKGAPIHLHTISPKGDYELITIGNDLASGQHLQYTVPGKFWFAVEVPTPNSFALSGCTVAPGFDFADFTLPPARELIELFPQHQKVIRRLSR